MSQNTFMDLLSQEAVKNNLVLSENGALEYASTGSALDVVEEAARRGLQKEGA